MEYLVQDKISHEAYGTYAALLSLSFIFTNIADFGINIFVTNRIASESENANKIFSTTFAYKLLVCIFYPPLVVLIGFGLGYRGENLWYLLLISFIQALFQTVYFFRSNFQAKQYFKVDAFASVLDRLILILIIGFLLAANLISLDNFIYGLVISTLISFLILYLILMLLYDWLAPKVNIPEIKKILKQSFPFAIIGILYTVNERIDMIMLERLGGEHGTVMTGLYAAAYRWLDAFMMYLWTILPVFYARLSYYKNDPVRLQKLISFGLIVLFIPMLYVAGIVFFFPEKFFLIFKNSTSTEIETMSELLKVLIIHGLIQGAFALYGSYLNASGAEKKVSWMVVLSVSINFLLNLIFIPRYGAIAAAYATLVSSLLVGMLYLREIIASGQIKIPFDIHFRLLLTGVLFFLFLSLLQIVNLFWILEAVLAGILLLAVTYIINRKSIHQILIQREF